MKRLFFLLLITIFSKNVFSQTLFDSNFYEVNFTSNNIEFEKINRISDIKLKSFNKILKNILLENDFNNLKKNLNEDFINSFIKNINIEGEKIINQNYYSKIRINYNKELIINYLRKHKIPYVEYLPEKFLTIIYEKNELSKNLFSLNNAYYEFLHNEKKFQNFYQIPNLDINDRYILNIEDIENKNIDKLNKFKKKYNDIDTLLIISEQDVENTFYTVALFTNGQIIDIHSENINNFDYKFFFLNIKNKILNKWKTLNKIQNSDFYSIDCIVNYYNLFELKKINEYLNNISIIKNYKLKEISYKKNSYEIFYFGDKKILYNLFKLNKINVYFEKENCNLYLK